MSGDQSRDADIDIGQLFGSLWRDKWRILLGAIIITALVFVVLSLISPKYKADTRILIDANESVYTRPTTDGPPIDQQAVDQENVVSQVEVITSSDLLKKVAAELSLSDMEEFNDTKNPSLIKEGFITLGLIEAPEPLSTERRVLEAVRERLSVYAVENSRVIVIEFETKDRELAAKFPNELAKAYASLEGDSQRQNTGDAAQYLAAEITDLEKSLRDAEARVADFRNTSGLLIGDNDEILANQQLAQLSTELSRVRAERSSIQARVQSVERALQNGTSLDTLPDVINSPLIERLREQEIQLNAQIADLSTTLLSGHPRIKALRSQLSDLNVQIRNQAENVLEGLRNQATTERTREAELVADVNRLKVASSEANGQQVELSALEREAASQRALLESYLIRFREASSRGGETDYAPTNARIISTATVPTQAAFPKMLPLLAATFIGSILLMSLITLMRELLSGRALIVNDMQSANISNVVEHHKDHTPLSVAEIDNLDAPNQPPANDNFSVDALTKQLINKGAGRAIIVSPEGDAGSVCSVGLVRSLADEGLRSVLVDLTGTAAASQHMLADFTLPGITDLLASETSYSEVIHADAATNAHIIPTGNADAETAMRAIERLPIIINALSSAYDIVVIDCGPTDADGLKRLASTDTEIVLAMVEPQSQQVIHAAENLVAGGYNDVLIVTSDDLPTPIPPRGDQRFA